MRSSSDCVGDQKRQRPGVGCGLSAAGYGRNTEGL